MASGAAAWLLYPTVGMYKWWARVLHDGIGGYVLGMMIKSDCA